MACGGGHAQTMPSVAQSHFLLVPSPASRLPACRYVSHRDHNGLTETVRQLQLMFSFIRVALVTGSVHNNRNSKTDLLLISLRS